MPGIAASEPPRRPLPSPFPLLAFHRRALLYRHSMHPFAPSNTFPRSQSLSVVTFPLDRLQCQWTTTDSLLGSLESIRSCARVRVRMCVCASVRERNRESERKRERERSYLSTGNKLTSCRKLANVPWEDSPGERVATLREGGRRFRRAEEQETLLRAVSRNASSIGQNRKNFLFEIYYSCGAERAFVINARLRGRITNAKDDRKRSGKGQKNTPLFRKSRVAHSIEHK